MIFLFCLKSREIKTGWVQLEKAIERKEDNELGDNPLYCVGVGRHSNFAGAPFLDQSEMFKLLTGCAPLQEVEGGDVFESEASMSFIGNSRPAWIT